MFRRRIKIKNLEGYNTTELADKVLSTLHCANEYYTIDCANSQILIKWKDHNVVVQDQFVWFDGKIQTSVHNVVEFIEENKEN